MAIMGLFIACHDHSHHCELLGSAWVLSLLYFVSFCVLCYKYVRPDRGLGLVTDQWINTLNAGNPLRVTLPNSEDPDDMPAKLSISSGPAMFAMINTIFRA